ncbi:MAG: hypothetical protein ACOWWO_02555 [Peptococcaceae bacterium]
MPGFFNYSILGTYTGAVVATILTVQFLKEIKPLKSLSLRWVVMFTAENIVLLTSIFSGNFELKDILLHFLNGLLVAGSAMGGLQVLHYRLFYNTYRQQEEKRNEKNLSRMSQPASTSSRTNHYPKGST